MGFVRDPVFDVTTFSLNDRGAYPLGVDFRRVWIWTKVRWADEWTPRPDFTPTQATWKIAPGLDSLTCERDYGFGIRFDGARETRARLGRTRLYILARFETDVFDQPLDWLGRTLPPVTKYDYPARIGFPRTGTQTIPAVGFLRALQQTPILSTVHEDKPDGTLKRADGSGAVFNPNSERGNRTLDTSTLEVDGQTTLAAHGFADAHSLTSTHWSTRDIVQHLLTFHVPTKTRAILDAGTDIPWTIGALDALPDWDKPRIETDGQTTAAILDRLLRPSKLLGWRVRPVVTHPTRSSNESPFDVEPPTVESLNVEFFTAARTAIVLPSVGTLPAAVNQHTIDAIADPNTTIDVKEDTRETVSQIRVRGPLEIGVCTLRHGTGKELTDDWSGDLKTAYDVGGSGEDGYADRTPSEQRRADAAVRDQPKHRPVYSRLKLVEEWDGNADGHPVFVQDSEGSTFAPYTASLEFLEKLPLYESITYTGDATAVDESGGLERIQPIHTLEHPTKGDTRVRVDRIGKLASGNDDSFEGMKPFSINVGLESESTDSVIGIRLEVSQAPQHAIAGSGFSGTSGDGD
ncbi:MAG: hypothetical protein AAFX06_31415, partial [Planctomycetota bacterium]